MFSLLGNGRSVAVRTFAYVLVAVVCLALTSCETPTEPTPADTAGTLDVSPNSRSVSSTLGATTFTVSSTVGWSVEDDAAWLTAIKTDASTIGVGYEANAGTSSRTANIKVVGTGGVEETVTVTQAAATAAVFDVSPNSRSVTDVPGTTTFTVSSTVGWSIESVLPNPPTPDADWLTATKTDGSTISVSYEPNAGTSSRTANIKAVGTGEVEETVGCVRQVVQFQIHG